MSEINAYGLSSRDYAKLYSVWKNMVSRCHNPKDDRFYTYGARGISVCGDWRNDFHTFVRFALENGWKVGLSIERLDVDGDYCPENCTFITMKEQMRNKTNNVYLTIAGKTKCLAEWCEIFGVDFQRTWARYKVLGITDINRLFYKGDLRDLQPNIIQLSVDGKVIAEYERIGEASRKSGAAAASIRNACKGKYKTAGGYCWRYSNGGGCVDRH